MGAVSVDDRPSDGDNNTGAAQQNVRAPLRHPKPNPSSGYESPDDEHHFVREPHRLKRILPHLRNRAAAELLESGDPGNHASLNDLVTKARKMRSVGVRDRIACVQWTWFTMTMVYHFSPPLICPLFDGYV
jgi:hypothetical protein